MEKKNFAKIEKIESPEEKPLKFPKITKITREDVKNYALPRLLKELKEGLKYERKDDAEVDDD